MTAGSGAATSILTSSGPPNPSRPTGDGLDRAQVEIDAVTDRRTSQDYAALGEIMRALRC